MRIGLGMLSAACLALACAHAPAQDVVQFGECQPCPPRDIESSPDALVILARGSCGDGVCPSYVVVLHPDGLLEYTGKRSVATAGYCTARLGEARRQRLLAALAHPELPPHFENVMTADLPMDFVGLSPQVAGRAIALDWQSFSPDDPRDRLAAQLDQLLETEHWVGARDAKAHPQQLHELGPSCAER